MFNFKKLQTGASAWFKAISETTSTPELLVPGIVTAVGSSIYLYFSVGWLYSFAAELGFFFGPPVFMAGCLLIVILLYLFQELLKLYAEIQYSRKIGLTNREISIEDSYGLFKKYLVFGGFGLWFLVGSDNEVGRDRFLVDVATDSEMLTYLSVPVIVAEKKSSLTEVFQRSEELTRGNLHEIGGAVAMREVLSAAALISTTILLVSVFVVSPSNLLLVAVTAVGFATSAASVLQGIVEMKLYHKFLYQS